MRLVGFDEFADYPLRICRPIGLKPAEIELLVESACQRIGHRYDLRNIVDLARYHALCRALASSVLTLGSGRPDACDLFDADRTGVSGRPLSHPATASDA
ncbi:hypothetical protein DSL92_01650 [Billgrantia gudaonensis]|uniref:Uncharacterized protein n=1 Tax=Billgrantia gudaonensis TaxID=376427 RepID=A0A3S0NXC9_9GAMM|nr:hypothetical protein DSL92_01650 [Halomonas gudaonensis]